MDVMKHTPMPKVHEYRGYSYDIDRDIYSGMYEIRWWNDDDKPLNMCARGGFFSKVGAANYMIDSVNSHIESLRQLGDLQ